MTLSMKSPVGQSHVTECPRANSHVAIAFAIIVSLVFEKGMTSIFPPNTVSRNHTNRIILAVGADIRNTVLVSETNYCKLKIKI